MITCPEYRGDRSQIERVHQAILGGADAVQLRDKNASDEELLRQARELLTLMRPLGVPLIVNDRVAVAKTSGAQGAHLGQSDGTLADARRLLGERSILGRSTHTPEQGEAAQEEGFDYIGVGPVFNTPTKPGRTPVGLEYVRYASRHLRVPFAAIGGIDETNIGTVRASGARCIAVVRAVLAQPDPRQAAVNLKQLITKG